MSQPTGLEQRPGIRFQRISPTGRLVAAAVAVVCWSILVVGAFLTPRSVGHGTHRGLGLPYCGMLARTGYPCPTCGMTTSVSAMTRGRVRLAFRAHPFGIVLFAALAGMAMTAPAVVVTGKIPHRMVPRPWWIWVAVILMVIGVLGGWGLKVAAGRASGLYPRAR